MKKPEDAAEKKKITFYFVASTNEQLEHLKKLGVKNTLVSYLYFKKNKISLDLLKNFESVLIDSGGYSLQKDYHNRVNVKEYLNFINNNEDLFYAAFTIDPKEFNGTENIRNLKILAKNSKIPIIPVWHDKDDLSELRHFSKRFSIIGFDSRRINLLDDIGSETRIHILGCSSLEILKKYKFASCDFSTWSNGCRYGHIYILDAGRLCKMHYKKDIFRIKGDFEQNITSFGFRLSEIRDEYIRNAINIKTFLKAESWLSDYYRCGSFSENQRTNLSLGGPKTLLGKKVSSLNAMKTGRYASLDNMEFFVEICKDENLKSYFENVLQSAEGKNNAVKEELKELLYRLILRKKLSYSNATVTDFIRQDNIDKLQLKIVDILEKLKVFDKNKKKSN